MNLEEDEWITTRQAARMLNITGRTARAFLHQKQVTIRVTPHWNYYRREEVEALVRDPQRLRRNANRQRDQAGRKEPDLEYAFAPERRRDAKTAMQILGVSEKTLINLANKGKLTVYQEGQGRGKRWYDVVELYDLRDHRAREKERQEQKRQNRAPARLPRPRYITRQTLKCTGRIGPGDLSVQERYMGDWVTARQVAFLLGVTMQQAYRLRDQGRIRADRCPDVAPGHNLWLFRKADVLALRGEDAYFERHCRYVHHCTPEARARNAAEKFRKAIEACNKANRIAHYSRDPSLRALPAGDIW